MTKFKEELAILIKEYADYDEEKCSYENKRELTLNDRQKIEASLIGLISQYLSQNGLQESAIDAQMKKLQLLFHPDKYSGSLPENKWLQYVLSEGSIERGSCFHLVGLCADKLKHPENHNFYKSEFEGISTMDVLIAELEKRKGYAKTFTQRALLESVLAMLQTSTAYHQTVEERVPGVWTKKIINVMPYLTTGYCIGFFLEELALLYAVTFVLSKGGKWLEQSGSSHCQMIGHVVSLFSNTISNAIMALLARLTELNLLMVKGAMNLTIDTGEGIYKLLVASSEKAASNESKPEECRALMLAPQNLLGGLPFKSFELKLAARPLESKLEELGQQWFIHWRLGNTKMQAIKKALDSLCQLDANSNEGIAVKLEKAQEIIEGLADDKAINTEGSGTQRAIQTARDILQLLLKSDNPEERMSLAVGYTEIV
ncbi:MULTISPECIES: hypothetical protein [unclassified Legionella]|uniref:hypothetical protein n=1 Tax=unclassified Legionella TaxID=2622702 RepID=UPI0010558A7D|nr:MULTISPECIES: hypothetical protein [unclassified Legionella]MDI9817699.1 hypothetical protein [Legionella sp. PL877]